MIVEASKTQLSPCGQMGADMLEALQVCWAGYAAHGGDFLEELRLKVSDLGWVAVKELKLSYHNGYI